MSHEVTRLHTLSLEPPSTRPQMSRISGLADMKKAAGGAPDDKKKKQNTLYTGGALS